MGIQGYGYTQLSSEGRELLEWGDPVLLKLVLMNHVTDLNSLEGSSGRIERFKPLHLLGSTLEEYCELSFNQYEKDKIPEDVQAEWVNIFAAMKLIAADVRLSKVL